jgi:hypothetical protein
MSPVKPPAATMTSKVALPIHPRLRLPLPAGPSFAGVLARTTKPLVATNGCKTQAAAGHAVVVAPHHEHEPEGHKHSRARRDEDDDLDPAARQAAQLAPPVMAQPMAEAAGPGAAGTNARVSMEELLPALVKKIAWSGDAQRGTVRMELGAGELAGATLMVSSEGGRVRVQLQAPPGTDVRSWRERLRGRLEAKGLSIESLEVE